MASLDRRTFLATTTATTVAAGLPRAARGQLARRPNIVFFMTDDQRWDGMSCAGNQVLSTPHMDRLASEGALCDNMFVVNALCSPSRACYLTGLYSHNNGLRTNGQREGLSLAIPTFPELLRASGYQTAFVGKWHMKGHGRDRPWDHYFGFQGQGRYHNPRIAPGVDQPDQQYDGHITDILADNAIAFLEQRHRQPFCLLVWFKAPHRSWEAAERYQHLWQDFRFPRPETFETDYAGKPRAVAEADMKIGDFPDVPDLDTFLSRYYRTLVGVDDNLGRILATMDRLGLTENTITAYGSDNGFFLGEHRFFDKRLMYEPSIRVPLLVRWPQRIAAGSRVTGQALNIDLAPTFLDLAGAPPLNRCDGRSLRPLLEGAQPESVNWRRDWLYEYFEYPGVHSVRQHRGLRTDQFKYIHYHEDPAEEELIDLAEDPLERENRIADPRYREIVTWCRRRLPELRREAGEVC